MTERQQENPQNKEPVTVIATSPQPKLKLKNFNLTNMCKTQKLFSALYIELSL